MATTSASISNPDSGSPPGQLGLTRDAVGNLEKALRNTLEFSGLTFDTGLPEAEYVAGQRGAHRCDYRITLPGGVFLGRLEVSRHSPFKESELRLLECCLADFCLRLNLLVAQDPQPAGREADAWRP